MVGFGSSVDERIEIDFDVRIALVQIVAAAVRRIVGVETVFQLPFVGHAVAVGIGLRRAAFQCRQAADIRRSVDESFVAVERRAVAHLLQDAAIVGIAGVAATDIGQYTFVGLAGRILADGFIRIGFRHEGLGGFLAADAEFVVARDILVPLYEVAGDVVATRAVVRDVEDAARVFRPGAGLVVVADHVDFTVAAAAVGRFESPVVDDVVAVVYRLGAFDRGEPRVAARMIGQQVVVERRFQTAPDAAEAVRTFGVLRAGEAVRYQTPLDGEIFGFVDREAFVDRPRNAQVIQYDVLLSVAAAADAVGVGREFVSHADTQVADDDVAGVDDQRTVGEADAVSRGTLSGDGDVVVPDAQGRFEVDVSVYGEDDDARSLAFDGFAQAARARIIEVGDDHDPAAPTAGRLFAETFRSRESELLRGRCPNGEGGNQSWNHSFFHIGRYCGFIKRGYLLIFLRKSL